MTSSEDDIDGWEKDDYKELSDSEHSNISYMDDTDDESNIKKLSPAKKKKKKKQDPKGTSISQKPKLEYSNILQEEDDFFPE